MIDRAAPPDSVSLRAEALVGRIAAAAGGALDPFPVRPPPLARGAAAYREQCLQCHGPAGLGDGPKAKGLKGPPPANLADRSAMSTVGLKVMPRPPCGSMRATSCLPFSGWPVIDVRNGFQLG